MDTLTCEQLHAFNVLLSGKNVFLTGSGGTGKSYLIETIYNEMPLQRKRPNGVPIRVSVTAMTGCAAVLLGSHAKTLHSWAGVGLGKGTPAELVAKIRKNARAKKNWVNTDILVIDEISMMQPELLEKLDQVGRIMRRCASKPFGGIQVLLTGDFLQLPPIMKGEALKFAFESTMWNTIIDVSVELKQIQRQRDDVFRKILEEARVGKMSAESIAHLELRKKEDWKSLKIRPTLLFPRRAEVDIINEANLRALGGPFHTYAVGIAYDEKIRCGFNSKDEGFKRYIEVFDRDAPYLSELVLANGAQVMLIKNMDVENRLINGSRGVVIDFMNDAAHTPIVEFIGGLRLPMPAATWEMEEYPGVCRTQVPLRLAYAITTHRSQGATLDCALIDIGSNIFEFGQAYVALSRVRSLDCLYIHDFDPDAITAHHRVIEFYAKLHSEITETVDDNPV